MVLRLVNMSEFVKEKKKKPMNQDIILIQSWNHEVIHWFDDTRELAAALKIR